VRRQQAIRSLVRFARLVSDHPANEDPLQHLAEALVDHAGADAAAVYLVAGDRLKLAASRDLPDRLQAWTPEADDVISGEFGRAALAALGNDAFTQAKTLPVASAGRLFGAAVLLWKQPDDGSEQWHDELAKGLADLAAAALSTSEYLRWLVRANEELGAAQEVLARNEAMGRALLRSSVLSKPRHGCPKHANKRCFLPVSVRFGESARTVRARRPAGFENRRSRRGSVGSSERRFAAQVSSEVVGA
jgi:hypothetical protein